MMLPFQITAGLMLALVGLCTFSAMALKWKPALVFFGTSSLAMVAFIPACTGIMHVIDTQRFGMFSYASYSQVQDFRIERYLPDLARGITLEKTAMGHRARYTLTQAELQNFLDTLWASGDSAIPREGIGDGEVASAEELQRNFGDLGWPPLTEAVLFHSPVQGDGGGATYYFEPTTNTVYHRAGYW